MGMTFIGCATITPVHTSYKSAKINPQTIKFTGSYSAVNYYDSQEMVLKSHNYDLQLAADSRKKILFLPEILQSGGVRGGASINKNHRTLYLICEGMFCIVEDWLALGGAWGPVFYSGDDDTLDYNIQWEPVGLYFTIPVCQFLNINLASRLISLGHIIPTLGENYYATLNSGAGINIGNVRIQPEMSCYTILKEIRKKIELLLALE